VSPLHFTGKMRDTETGLDDFPARYYSSIQGRWYSPDWASAQVPVPYADLHNPQTLNLYAYVGDDPTNHPDADGHFILGALAGLVGNILGSDDPVRQIAEAMVLYTASLTHIVPDSTHHPRKAQNKPKLHPKSKPNLFVKANPPISKAHTKAAASQEVDYFSADAKGNRVQNHTLGLSEKFTSGQNSRANICNPPCVQKDPDLIREGEFEDLQYVNTGKPFSVERRWTVDGQPAKVLDPNNKPFDYEVNHASTETNPAFQMEYKNDPNQ
jgi:RHS repeat-associated protein